MRCVPACRGRVGRIGSCKAQISVRLALVHAPVIQSKIFGDELPGDVGDDHQHILEMFWLNSFLAQGIRNLSSMSFSDSAVCDCKNDMGSSSLGKGGLPRPKETIWEQIRTMRAH